MLIVILSSMILGGGFWFMLQRHRKAAAAAATWPSVEGRITASEVLTRRDEGELEYRPHVAYAYAVGGRAYAGDRVRFGLTRYGLDPAKRLCARYAVGNAVQVYYDPTDPSHSVLERDAKA